MLSHMAFLNYFSHQFFWAKKNYFSHITAKWEEEIQVITTNMNLIPAINNNENFTAELKKTRFTQPYTKGFY